MKKSMAVLSAFMIGVNCFASGTMVMAEQNVGENAELNCSKGNRVQESLFSAAENNYDFEKESLDFFSQTPNPFGLGKEETKENLVSQEGIEDKMPEESVLNGKEDQETGLESKSSDENLSEDTEKIEAKETQVQKPTGMENLQIPQKFEVVMDPWEMDGKGQIYSEQYVIQNTGEKAGVLTLSHLTCKPQEQSGVVVKTDKTGLHDNEEKSVYMEMVFGNGERIVLSEESSEYQIELQSGGELALCFAGEINEYAEEGWKNREVSVGVVYSWEIVETETNEGAEDIEAIEDGDTNSMENDSTDTSVDQQKEDESDTLDVLENESENGEENLIGEAVETDEENQELDEENSQENEETIILDLQNFEESEIIVDSWKMDEDGQIASEQYVIRNTGDRAGIFGLSKLMCQPREESGIIVQSKKEELEEIEEKAVYVEMVLENGETIILSLEEIVYKVEMGPGEEIVVCFEGEMNGDGIRSLEEGELIVSALCSWNEEETKDEQSPGMENGLTDQKEEKEEYKGNV